MFYSRYLRRLSDARGIIALAVVLMACLLDPLPTQADGGHWTVSAVDGTVTVIGNGNEIYPASKGMPVIAGSTVVTERDSAAILTKRGDSITVYPDTEMTIPSDSAADGPNVLQSFGRLLFRMETRESGNFEVRTPFLAATVKGTTFTVVVTRTQATVSVAEGSVRVEASGGGESRMVHAGWKGTVAFDREFVDVTARRSRQAMNALEETGSVAGDRAASTAEPGATQGGDARSGGSMGGGSKDGSSSGGGSQGDASKPGRSKGGGR